MALHACLNNRTVELIIDVTSEEHFSELAAKYTSVISLENETLSVGVGWEFHALEFSAPGANPIPLDKLVESRIKTFQAEAAPLILDLYVTNTLAGITTEQSDLMFQDYSDVLIRLREGAWPTALFRLQQKEASGFVTQALKDQWAQKILTKLNEILS